MLGFMTKFSTVSAFYIVTMVTLSVGMTSFITVPAARLAHPRLIRRLPGKLRMWNVIWVLIHKRLGYTTLFLTVCVVPVGVFPRVCCAVTSWRLLVIRSDTTSFVSKMAIYEEKSLCPWWRHQMETFSALMAICAGNSLVTGEFPVQRPVTRSFDVFVDLRLNKRLSKQSWDWWFETLSRPLWRHSNVMSHALLEGLCNVDIKGTHVCDLVGDPARAVSEYRDVAKIQP